MTTWHLTNVRPMGGAAATVSITGGRIAAIAPAAPPAGEPSEDGRGMLLLPGFVEGHTHLDKTTIHLPDWLVNAVGPRIEDKIDTEREWRARTGHDAGAASLALARAFLAAGTTRIRSHVDVDTVGGTRHVARVLETREAMRGLQEIQIVAFPQSGILARQGTERLLDAALAMGADIVGGLDPCAIERDPVRHLDIVFGLAERHGKPVDIHLHEPGTMGAFSLDLILERTRALGMEGKVVVSHAFCLGDIAERERDALLARMAQLGVAIATTAPASRPVPPVAACRAAGVTIFGGNDGIRDTWTPYGSPDMLERAMLIGLRNNFRRDDEVALAFDCVSAAGAQGCGFSDHGLLPGARADLVLVEARTLAEAVVARPVRRLVVSAGRVVARDGVLSA
ncbi:amidohydrolase family protein [Roseomonas alkaliterrae]|uniref:Cytosine deaminase n=1 Tax=Neoroseomonas alkaliterrae TaxID=1452450 RepID=A0A840Y3M5_9PROT|nr:amidohydrolase family protein [Neoroseomonas alkaliterrae]MBB5689232.1 cytosine deaminase [Neoroseomonas alkaliterrae]MBR0677666.1 amidohydrolase family protein [Neoroseomonas alkaliterrae]